MSDGFEIVENKMLPTWNGMTKKNSDGESVPLEKSDASFVVGYYLGMDHIKGKDGKDIAVHRLQFVTCGDRSHLSDQEVKEGDNIMVWGATALNDKLVNNVPVGVLTKILWKGKVKAKNNPSMRYHDFEVMINKEKTIDAPAQPVKTPSAPKDTTANAVTTEPANVMEEEDDDLPF